MISKKTLDSSRQYLESEIVRLNNVLERSTPSIDLERQRGDDRGNTVEEMLKNKHNHNATKQKLEDCKAALIRIDEGYYGLCVDCGNRIDEGRLGARPEASRCKECQEKIGLRVR